MNQNEALIQKFYESFQKKDHAGMASCYHPNAHFYDEVFQDLNGPAIGAMWRMLCENGRDLEVVFNNVSADDSSGRAHWDARYTFSATKRKIFNQIDAVFKFQDGLIIDHRDSFDLKKWLGMALGPIGSIFGGTKFLQNKFRGQVKNTFRGFLKKNQIEANV
jgi:ketosteroid isomerase-like protein